MAQLVHANQPEALSYHYYVDKQSGAGTAILRVFKDLPGVGWRHLYKKGGLENASATCCAAGSRPIGLAAVMNGTPHAKART